MKLKSQSAMEFIILASFMLLVILGFFTLTSSNVLEAGEESNRKTSKDIAEFAYKEIETAKSVNDGYIRLFSIPQTVNGINYTINITDDRELIVNYLDNEYVKFLPSNVTGNISKGLNLIRKIEGIVYLSSIESAADLAKLLMKNTLNNIINFDDNGNVVLRGIFIDNTNPSTTANDEFVVKGKVGENVAVINLATGNMFIRGSLQQNQLNLNPSGTSNDFIVKNSAGNVVAFIDDVGNLYLKGILTQNGNP